MNIGDVVLHKAWSEPVLLVSRWERAPDRIYWEVLLEGNIELVKENELEIINGSR
jgi:hypothetical protein|tara:strand:+ start:1901 stop:2065 length:165 start_codon:yes stop_codon:yes gene_type:complete